MIPRPSNAEILVSLDFLTRLFMLPPEAEIVGAAMDYDGHTLRVLVDHADLPGLGGGLTKHLLNPVHHKDANGQTSLEELRITLAHERGTPPGPLHF
jgi:hypothetical protein